MFAAGRYTFRSSAERQQLPGPYLHFYNHYRMHPALAGQPLLSANAEQGRETRQLAQSWADDDGSPELSPNARSIIYPPAPTKSRSERIRSSISSAFSCGAVRVLDLGAGRLRIGPICSIAASRFALVTASVCS